MAKRIFTLDEALELLPTVKELTAQTVGQVDELTSRIDELPEADPHREQLIAELKELIDGWAQMLTRLSAEAKGLWLVDFDNGHGYYCWRYPEETIQHFHGYEDGFAGRMKIV